MPMDAAVALFLSLFRHPPTSSRHMLVPDISIEQHMKVDVLKAKADRLVRAPGTLICCSLAAFLLCPCRRSFRVVGWE